MVLDLSKLGPPPPGVAPALQPQQVQIQLDTNGQVIVSQQELELYLLPINKKLDMLLTLLNELQYHNSDGRTEPVNEAPSHLHLVRDEVPAEPEDPEILLQ